MGYRIIEENMSWIEDTWKKVDKKLLKVAVRSRDKLPSKSVNGLHDDKKDFGACWTNGFWGGMMWLMYEATKNDEYKKTARRSQELLNHAIIDDYKDLNHDVGFMWHLTSGADYRLTGDKKAYGVNLIAASILSSRYHIDGGFIRAWNSYTDNFDNSGWTIIDSMMNLPLLYWASRELHDDRFTRIAMRHADMTMRDHIRADGSTYHIVEHDVNTGKVIQAYQGQGYTRTSCWSRGLAWAIYGFVLSYIHTKKQEYLDTAKKTANYFAEHVIKYGYLPPIDFDAPEEPSYYDSTAGVCSACGLLELAKYVDEDDSKMYIETAVNILKVIDKMCCDYDEDTDSIVGMGSERYPHDKDAGIHIPLIYGDLFFVEALTKLRKSDFLIW